jgi:hypothetical protein
MFSDLVGSAALSAAALLERAAPEPHTHLRYFCSPQRTDSALYPIISQMEQLLFVRHELHTLADRAERWRCQGALPTNEWLTFCDRAKAVRDKVSAWEKALKVAGMVTRVKMALRALPLLHTKLTAAPSGTSGLSHNGAAVPSSDAAKMVF